MKKLLLFLWSMCGIFLIANAQNSPCNASFTYQTDGTIVRFYPAATTVNHPQKHYWLFGDGTLSDMPNPVHSYSGPGTYLVKHYIKDSLENCSDSSSATIIITTPTCSIDPKFEWRPDSLDCKRIRFINQSSPISPNVRFTWKFGDGTSSNDINPSHTYSQNGNYNVCLIIDGGNNCVKEICKTVTIACDSIPCSLQIDFESKKDSVFPNKIYFFSRVFTPVTVVPTYKWSFGDGAYSTEANPVHAYNQPGTYNVCLRVAISNTCVQEICKAVVVMPVGDSCRLEVSWRAERDSLSPNKIRFINETIVPSIGAVYQWTFGDGATSSEKNPVHIYNQPGEYKVCLLVKLNNTCIKESCKPVRVEATCRIEAKYEFKIDSAQKLKVYFINKTVSNQTTIHYIWKFGDGSSSIDANPVHVYQQPGIYEVCLVAETANGCRSEYCAKVELRTENCSIQAKFVWKKDSINPRKIWFTNLSQPVGAIWRTYWSYGDGTQSQDFNSKHEYAQAGKYQVCLKVVSLNECVSYYCDSVIVRLNDTCVNKSGFKWEQSANNPLEFRFKPEFLNSNWKYYWKFGDGTVSDNSTPAHKYEKAGIYTVCLTVVQSTGCQTTTCKQVVVGAGCDAVTVKYEYVRDLNRPNKISFIAISNQSIVKQKWIIKRDSTVNGFPYTVVLTSNNPTFIFPFTGSYTVCLEATTLNGCVKQYCERIVIEKVVMAPGLVNPITVSPNPARNVARIQLKLENPTAVSVTVLDGAGSVKWIQLVNGVSGNNTIALPVEQLSQGQYLVKLVFANQIRWTRFQKM